MSAPVATEEKPVPEPTPAGPAADAQATPKPPEKGETKALDAAKAEAKPEPAKPVGPSEDLRKALGNVRGLARRVRALEKENADLRVGEKGAAATPVVPKTVEEELSALPREKDAEGKELVQFDDEWMSPRMARDVLETRRAREEFLKDRDERNVEKRAADENHRRETTSAAYAEMAIGIEASVQTLMRDSFSAAPEARKPKVEAYLISVADGLIEEAGKQAKAERKDPLEVLLQDGFLEDIAEKVRVEGIETFGAFAEAQIADNTQHVEQHPVTTPKGQPAVEPAMGIEQFEALSPAERRAILARLKAGRQT